MGGNAGEIRDFLNDIHQPAGRGEIRAAVPGVEQDGQPPAVGFLIDGEHLRVVDIKMLEIRVELNAPQPPALDIVHLRLNIGHVLVPGSQAGELGVFPALVLNKLVDGADLLHFCGHRTHQNRSMPAWAPRWASTWGRPTFCMGMW